MLLSEPMVSLIRFFGMSLIKLHRNSQRMSDSFYYITEYSELKLKDEGPKHTHVGQPCLGIFAWEYIYVQCFYL